NCRLHAAWPGMLGHERDDLRHIPSRMPDGARASPAVRSRRQAPGSERSRSPPPLPTSQRCSGPTCAAVIWKGESVRGHA
ncbi:MAG TPA: hypothetical protein VGP82_07275, partial [Ktedonobacterales bacterium]|nr:hypothetical protein [Ktedonobacterales bacterium]